MADFPISPVVRRVVYTGSAGTGPYAFTFEILTQTDIDVYVDSTLKTLTTDYTVTINSNGTGAVNFVTAPGSTKRITIVGARDITRASDYVTGGDFTAASLNVELDQQTIFNQQNAEALGRAILAPVTDPASINMVLPVQTSRAGKILAFDSSGNPTVGEEIGNWRGNWAAGQAYTVRDLVKDASNANVYRANTAHTSSGTTPISSNADVAKWDLVVDAASAAASATAAAASASAAASSASAASTSASNASTSATNAASSASTATTQATNASNSATSAASSASSASSSASTATTQASNASTSATNAATSATSASNSASTATTQATNASNSASAASTSATNAASSASAASTSASNASTSATNASNSASTATTQATNSANSATASAASAVSAASSAASAAALLDNFDDRYLGAKTGDPSVDNDGNALLIGALYFNTTDGVMKVYTASGWIAASSASVATLATFEFVATAGQTVFSGADANSATLSYVAPALIVTLNGVRLRPGDDYTATNGTSITLVSAAALNDELVVDAFGSFLVANAVDLTTTQTIAGIKTFSSNSIFNANVGIGTSSPGYKLQVNRTGNGAAARFTNGSTIIDLWNDSSSSYFGDGGALNALEINTSSNRVTLNTNNNQRLLIDSTGRVTKPFQPAFQAARDAGHVTNNQVIVFNSVRFNIGSHYSNSTGRFTAPVAGCYQFNAHTMLVNSTVSDHQISLRVNGGNYSTVNPGNVPNQLAMSIGEVIYLNAGDYVDVYYYDSSTNSVYGSGGLNWTGFSGFLLG